MKRTVYSVVKNDVTVFFPTDDWNGELNPYATINIGDSIFFDRSLIPKPEEKHIDLGPEFQSLLNGIPEEIWLKIFTICELKAEFSVFCLSCVSSYCYRVCTPIIRKVFGFTKLASNRVLLRFPDQKTLDLNHNNFIHSALTVQTNLTSLSLVNNTVINDDILSKCTTLLELVLGNNTMIHDESLCKLTNLTNLSLTKNNTITDDSISCLVNLEILSLENCTTVYDKGISSLTNLHTLSLRKNKNIKNKALLNLTNLETLNLIENTLILSVGHLKKLKYLYISQTSKVRTRDLNCEVIETEY